MSVFSKGHLQDCCLQRTGPGFHGLGGFAIPPKGGKTQGCAGRATESAGGRPWAPGGCGRAPTPQTQTGAQAPSAGRGASSHTRAPAPGLEPGSGSPDPAGTRHRLSGTSPNFGRNFGQKRAVRPLPSRHLQLPARRPGPPRAPRGPPGSPRGPPGRGRPPARPRSRGLGSLTSGGGRRQLSLPPRALPAHHTPRDLRRLRGCRGLPPPGEPHGEREPSDPARVRRQFPRAGPGAWRRRRRRAWPSARAPPALRRLGLAPGEPRRGGVHGVWPRGGGCGRRAGKCPPPCRLLRSLERRTVRSLAVLSGGVQPGRIFFF